MKKAELGYHHKKQFSDRTEYYNSNDQRHRTDGPAVENSNGSKEWWLNGQLHRTDGPATEYSNSTKYWWLNGQLHRTDGPAIENSNGSKYWYLNGQLHRTDGPAVEDSDGSKAWYLNGQQLAETEFNRKMSETAKQIAYLKYRRRLALKNFYRQRSRERRGRSVRVSSSLWSQTVREYNRQIEQLTPWVPKS